MTSYISFGRIWYQISFCCALASSKGLVKAMGNISSIQRFGNQAPNTDGNVEPAAMVASPISCHPAMNKSSYPVEAWSFWTLYLEPVLLSWCFCNQRYYKHFIQLVRPLQLCFQFKITTEEVKIVCDGFINRVKDYKWWGQPANLMQDSIYLFIFPECIIDTHLVTYQHVWSLFMHYCTLRPPDKCGPTGHFP